MNVALFGGTFDPVHSGHIAVARAAQQRFSLGRVYLVPADIPPHKQSKPVTPYHHRFAMLALATQHEKDLIPSLLEAPDVNGHMRYGANYSIDTVRRFRQTLKKSDRLFFLIGIDAFLDIGKWREPEALLRECEFVIVSRPGFSLADVAGALPESMRPKPSVMEPFSAESAKGDLVISGAVLHLLENVEQDISATRIREAAAKGRSITRWVPEPVADYIKRMGLYRATRAEGSLGEDSPTTANHGAPLVQLQSAQSSKTPEAAAAHPDRTQGTNLQVISGGKRRKAARSEKR